MFEAPKYTQRRLKVTLTWTGEQEDFGTSENGMKVKRERNTIARQVTNDTTERYLNVYRSSYCKSDGWWSQFDRSTWRHCEAISCQFGKVCRSCERPSDRLMWEKKKKTTFSLLYTINCNHFLPWLFVFTCYCCHCCLSTCLSSDTWARRGRQKINWHRFVIYSFAALLIIKNAWKSCRRWRRKRIKK